VKKLHSNLGHPNAGRLAQALIDLGYSEEYIKCAREYRREFCAKAQRPKIRMHNRLKDASYFNYSISMDTVHIEWNGKQGKILVLQDD
jgi:hypothetical protein